MGYIDRYTRGAPSYSVGEGPLDIYQFIKSGYDTGAAQAKNQRISQLASQAYGQTGADRNATVQQAIGIDPASGYALANVGAQQDQAAAAVKKQQFARIAQAAQFIIQAKQQGNEAAAQGAYQAIVPMLKQFVPTADVPPTLDDAHMPNIYKVAAMAGATLPSQPKPISVAAGTTLLDPNTHQPVYSSPAKPQYDPTTGTLINTQTGTFTPVTQAPTMGNGTGLAPTIPASAAGAAPQGLPTETQAYVPKVMAALGGKPAFDAQGNPTPELLNAVQQVESGGDPNAVSPKGAQGAYQLMPATASSVGVTNPNDPAQARAGAAQYLSQLYKQFGGNANLALAAYNAGPTRVQQTLGGQSHSQTLADYKAMHTQDKAPSGYRYKSDGTLEAIPGGPASGSLAGQDPEQAMATLSPSDRALVKKLASYELLPSDLGRSKNRAELIGLATYLNPDFNISNAQAANAYLKDTAKSSPTSIGGQIQSMNMALHHLGTMMDANAALPGTGARPFNAIKNAYETTFNGNSPAGSAPSNWDQGKVYLTQELGKLLKGGVASEGEVKELEEALSASKSPEQRGQALARVADYIYGKIATMTDRRDRLLGNMAPKTSLLDAKAEQALIRAYKLGGEQAPALLPPGKSYATGAPAASIEGGTQPASIDALLQKYGGQ